MKAVSKDFGAGRTGRLGATALAGTGISPELRQVAAAFVDLQEARHEADYDHLRTYTRKETADLVQQAEQAFRNWTAVRGSRAADTYLVALLAQGAARG